MLDRVVSVQGIDGDSASGEDMPASHLKGDALASKEG
jgi:hypothetical protein